MFEQIELFALEIELRAKQFGRGAKQVRGLFAVVAVATFCLALEGAALVILGCVAGRDRYAQDGAGYILLTGIALLVLAALCAVAARYLRPST